MRPIWWDFDDEKALAAEETTFMFGPDYFVSTIIVHTVEHIMSNLSGNVCHAAQSLKLFARATCWRR